MLLARFTDFILRSRLNAFGMTFVIAFIPLIGTVGALMAALVTLRKGAVEGLLVFIAACLPYIIGYYAYADASSGQLAWYAMMVVVVGNVMTWVLAVLLREYQNWALELQFALIVGIVFVATLHFIYPDIQLWWASQMNAYFAKAPMALGQLKGDVTVNEIQARVVAVAAKYATGFLAVSVLFNALIQLGIARWWQAVLYNPGGLQKELHQIRLSHIAGVFFLLALALSYFSNAIVLDLMPVLYFIFGLAGLSVIHNLLAPAKTTWLWLLFIYMGIIWLFPISVILIAMVGLLDTYVDVRQKFSRNK